MGVMVPLGEILNRAVKEKVDIIGLSGLITPSLEEMKRIAREMTRRGMDVPLLIGGATTSKVHTAVKLDPEYPKVVYVQDASRAVGVAAKLLGEHPGQFLEERRSEYDTIRKKRQKKTKRSLCSIAEARNNKLQIDFDEDPPVQPKNTGFWT